LQPLAHLRTREAVVDVAVDLGGKLGDRVGAVEIAVRIDMRRLGLVERA